MNTPIQRYLSEGLDHVNVVERVHHRHRALQRELRRQLREVNQGIHLDRLLAENLAGVDHPVVQRDDRHARLLISLQVKRYDFANIHESVLNWGRTTVLRQKRGVHIDASILEAGYHVRRDEVAKGSNDAEIELLLRNHLRRLPLFQRVLSTNNVSESTNHSI